MLSEENKSLIDKAVSQRKQIKKTFQKLKKRKDLDKLIHGLHEDAFEVIDCLDCGNCCRTTSPLFKDRDITRLASHLKLTEDQFINEYLKVDEDDDRIFQSAPCPFFNEEDNCCSVYEWRPDACREYPHTDRRKMHQILSLTERNTRVCPAVAKIAFELEKEV